MTETYLNSARVCLICQTFSQLTECGGGKEEEEAFNVNYSYFYNYSLFAARNIPVQPFCRLRLNN